MVPLRPVLRTRSQAQEQCAERLRRRATWQRAATALPPHVPPRQRPQTGPAATTAMHATAARCARRANAPPGPHSAATMVSRARSTAATRRLVVGTSRTQVAATWTTASVTLPMPAVAAANWLADRSASPDRCRGRCSRLGLDCSGTGGPGPRRREPAVCEQLGCLGPRPTSWVGNHDHGLRTLEHAGHGDRERFRIERGKTLVEQPQTLPCSNRRSSRTRPARRCCR